MSWDEFQIVGELQEQNQNLLLQLDAKERELREVQIYLSKIQVRRFPRPSARSFARSLSLEVFVWSDAFLPAYDDDRPQTSEAREGKREGREPRGFKPSSSESHRCVPHQQ